MMPRNGNPVTVFRWGETGQVHEYCLTLISALQVNISNTWFLPQEGFPVFYRYFRDRITWFEADAVCQFHHGNLVKGK